MGCVPPEGDAEFVAAMERVLEVHARPRDPPRPVVCLDEQPKQLVRESRETAHTPRQGSWLNVAECELSALTRMRLDRHVPATEGVDRDCRAWAERRNREQTGVDWQFTADDARVKLKGPYSTILS